MTTDGVTAYQCIVLASALRLYARARIKANRSYTPRNMIAAAETLTGKKFKARDYTGAADALSAMVQEAQ